ncbi:hypothetical protein VCRA2119O48_110054 [Vibrio crassostreae]|nr:hypothetical protein VCRA2119O48_110054 [Vibrio crassostreae]CAK3974124.1 hypothetical protein VCRA212O16_500001 [Vibrio crassostreae]
MKTFIEMHPEHLDNQSLAKREAFLYPSNTYKLIEKELKVANAERKVESTPVKHHGD